MFLSENNAVRALTRPLRLALYKRSALFELDVAEEIQNLKLERPDAPAELASLKLARENMPSFRRAIWREAARRLSESAADASASRQPVSVGETSEFSKAECSASSEGKAKYPNLADAMSSLTLPGEHRIHLWTPGGPGSLMETLHSLADQGLMSVETDQDETGDPVLIFRPALRTPRRLEAAAV